MTSSLWDDIQVSDSGDCFCGCCDGCDKGRLWGLGPKLGFDLVGGVWGFWSGHHCTQ
jgi:hypothetical protein